MKKPFMFGEAALPQGYPPPGPVGQVIVKEYPASRVAVMRQAKAGDHDAAADAMFRPLFNHIKKNDIAMTSPVVMGYASEPASTEAAPVSMAFVYPTPEIGHPGADGDVSVETRPAMRVASVGVRGAYNESHFEKGLAQLRAWLATPNQAYEPAGPPRYLGYNSPFVPWFLRYGEVQIPIREKATLTKQ